MIQLSQAACEVFPEMSLCFRYHGKYLSPSLWYVSPELHANSKKIGPEPQDIGIEDFCE